MIAERDRELAALSGAAAAARDGHGSLVLIEGPAGAGKSALLAATPADEMRTLRAAGGEWERDYAFGAIRQMLVKVPVQLLTGAAALAAAIVASPPPEALEPGFGLLDAIYWAVAALAGTAPVLLAVDDLHWLDDASLQALAYLTRRVGDLPVLIVGTLRPAEPGAAVERLDGLREMATLLSPAPLSLAGVTSLVRAERADASDAECASLHTASGGNPLYLRELLRSGADGDAGIATLGERVVRRVRRLGPEAPALAGAIAVLGDGSPLALAAELAELDPATAQRLAHQLVRIEVLAGEDPPVFAHPVIRSSLYEVLSQGRRDSLHATAAELLEAALGSVDAVAGHLVALPPKGSEAVAVRLLAAGRDALSRGAVTTAANRLRRALDEQAGSRAEILFELGRAENFAQDPACYGHLEEALGLAHGDLQTRIRIVLSEALAYAGRWRELAAVLDAGADDPDPGFELAAIAAAMDANDAARVDRFTSRWDDLVRSSRLETPGSQAIAALLASEAVARGRTDEVAGHIGAAWRAGQFPAAAGLGSWPAAQLLMALIYSDDLDEADALGHAMTEMGRRTGATGILLIGALVPTWIAQRRGDLIEAEARIETVLAFVIEVGHAMWLTSAAWMLDEVLAERTSLGDFVGRLTSLTLTPEFDATRSGALLRWARAQVAAARSDQDTVAAELGDAEPVLRALEIGPAQIPWRSALARATGDPALAEEELTLARASGYPRPLGIALRTLGALRGDADLLRESIAVLERVPSPLERARTYADLGELHRTRGDLADARTELAVAADHAHRCGAERLLIRVRELQAAARARPRRPATTGREALTPRELRVVELAAAGRTNVAIAQELFVSVKTVETHLTNVYAKLGLTGRGARRQLGAALAQASGHG